jgi:hypothetical protein
MKSGKLQVNRKGDNVWGLKLDHITKSHGIYIVKNT